MTFFSAKTNVNFRTAKCFITECVEILKLLSLHGIIHRDFTPFNLIVKRNGKKTAVFLIDFGWAVHMGKTVEDIPMVGLGNGYYEKNDFSDFYALSVICERLFPDYSFSRKLIPLLRGIKSIVYGDKNRMVSIFNKIDEILLSDVIEYIYYSMIDNYHRFIREFPKTDILRAWIVNKLKAIKRHT